jgi:hypothetical protein
MSPDQKSVYASVVDNCCLASDADPTGLYLLGIVLFGKKTGIYEVSTSDRSGTQMSGATPHASYSFQS